MTVVNGDELAAALADRFQRIVPEGFQVRDDDGMLWYSVDPALSFWGGGGSGSYVRLNFDSHHGPLNERVVAVSEHSLNELQDFVDEESALPWPGEPHRPSAARGSHRNQAASLVRRRRCARVGVRAD